MPTFVNYLLVITKEEDTSVEELHNMEKNMSFPCKYCSKVKTSKEKWIKHLNKHETPDYDINNWGDDFPDKSSDSNNE
ncbi:serendipity locus protein beta-like [Aphis craccivora]|uniref:Serendipity locus protein beta-like n=1 Tax=Aphis craccivora TaxID=307492 RepID=A0A6G0ZAQ9_APHCR|nr:serendipity locus protein beta-like [Aphis craccivora]